MQVKCPKCATVLKVADPTGPVKIKCPKCATVLQIGGAAKPDAAQQPAKAPLPKPATPKPAARPAARQAPPAKPAQPATAPSMATDGGFDFLDLPGPAAEEPVRQFTQVNAPTRHLQPASKPAPVDDDDGDGNDGPPKRQTPKVNVSGMSKGTIAVLVGGVGILLLLIVVGVVVLASGAGKTAAPARKAPDGFEYKSINGVSAFMPEGTEMKDFPGQMDLIGVRTGSTTVYVLGSSATNNLEMNIEKLKSRLHRLLAAGIIGGAPHERNGNKGFKFRLDQGAKIPNMEIEVFQNEGRIIVMGVSNASSSGGNYVVGQESDPELRNVFLESLEIGPPSSGW